MLYNSNIISFHRRRRPQSAIFILDLDYSVSRYINYYLYSMLLIFSWIRKRINVTFTYVEFLNNTVFVFPSSFEIEKHAKIRIESLYMYRSK